MIYLNKKGISPLIASILLIGFTVALAAIVITWGSGFVERITKGTEEKTTKSIVCISDLNFEIRKVDCATKSIVIDNKGNIGIKGLRLRFFDVSGNSKGSADTEPINNFEVKTISLTAIPASTSKVEALAIIDIDGLNVTCSDSIKSKAFSPAC